MSCTFALQEQNTLPALYLVAPRLRRSHATIRRQPCCPKRTGQRCYTPFDNDLRFLGGDETVLVGLERILGASSWKKPVAE